MAKNNKEYKAVEELIAQFENRLSINEGSVKVLEQSGAHRKREIEEHFDKCIKAMATRRDALLNECSQKILDNKMRYDENNAELRNSIAACRKGLETGTLLFESNSTTSEEIWKAMKNMRAANVSEIKIFISLPSTMIHLIQGHGAVVLREPYTTPDMVTTFAGSEKGCKDEKGTTAQFKDPRGIYWNPLEGCFYVSDSQNNSIRKVTLEGEVSTCTFSGTLQYPGGIAMNYKENCLYTYSCVLSKNAIIKITSSGTVSVLAGGVKAGFDDGNGKEASFDGIHSITIHQQSGNIFICEGKNNAIRMITLEGKVSTIAGSKTPGFAGGRGKSAQFNGPTGIVFDEVDQTLLVCDQNNNRIRRVTLNGEVTTMCECELPSHIVQTQNRSIFVSSYHRNKIFRIVKDGKGKYHAQPLAGNGQKGRDDGIPTQSSFNGPWQMTLHEATNSLFVCDLGNNAIRKISFM